MTAQAQLLQLLATVRRTLHWHRLLGICPFRVQRQRSSSDAAESATSIQPLTVRCTRAATTLALLTTGIWALVFSALTYTTFADTLPAAYHVRPNKRTRWLVTVGVHLQQGFTMIAVQLVAVLQRQRHTRLLNHIGAMFDRIRRPDGQQQGRRFVRMLRSHWIALLVYFLLPLSSALVDGAPFSAAIVLLDVFIYGVFTFWLLFTAHVRLLLAFLSECSVLDGDRFEDVVYVWRELSTTFGWQLLLTVVNDLSTLSMIAYSLIVEYITGITGRLLLLFYAVAFFMPLAARMLWFVRAVDVAERRFAALCEAHVRWPSDDRRSTNSFDPNDVRVCVFK